jgi:photosystem II stability/assembly factor-like uncharacterized protein
MLARFAPGNAPTQKECEPNSGTRSLRDPAEFNRGIHVKKICAYLMLSVLAFTGGVGDLSAQLTAPLGELSEAFTWRSIGPVNISGRVTDVEGLPHPSKTFYVATAAGGVWKTTNNGTTFQLIWDNERVVSMGDLAIAPSDPEQVWAGTGEEDSRNSISAGGGIFKSTDGGESWELMGLEETQVIGRIRVHPTNPDIVYVAALGHIWGANPERGLYRTRDGGESWELVKFISDKAGFVDVILHPENPDVIFAASWERVRGPWFLQSGGPGSGLWKSTDGGDSWTEMAGNGFPTAEKGRIGLDISLSNPQVMYAMVEARKEEDDSGGTGLYRSTDGGESWEKRNEVNSRPFYYSQVRVDPADPDRVYFSSTPIQFSTDGGETYGTTTNGIHVDHHAMWIDPVDPDRIVVGNDGGVGITFDRGGNWITWNHIATGQFYHVSYNMDVPYRVCGGLQDNGLWCGPSRLADGNLSKYHWMDIHFGDGFVSVQDPEDHDLVWSESQGGAMARQNLATGDRTSLQKPTWEMGWRERQDTIVLLMEEGVSEDDPRILTLREEASADSIANDLRWNWNTPYLQSVHDRSWLYVGSNRVLKSTDWGDGMTPISPDLSYADAEKVAVALRTSGGITPDLTGAETYATVVSLAESPLRAGFLYAGTDDGRLWMTHDDGGEWTELTDRVPGIPEGIYVSRIAPSNHDVDRFYVSFEHHRTNDFTPYVYVTDDGGQSFRSIVANLPTGSLDFVHVITEDPRNENLLYVGTDVGAYVSTDRGASWQRFMKGIGHAVPVHDLKVHPRDRELIAATHGRAIWIMNIAPLQDLTDGILAQGTALFEPAPGFQFGQRGHGGESYGQAWFSRPTPGTNAALAYYLGSDLMEEMEAVAEAEQGDAPFPARPQVEITVANEAGEVIRTLSERAKTGINFVSWDLRGDKPGPGDLSPSKRVEAARMAARATAVRDSLVEEGWSEMMTGRLTGLFTGETDPMDLYRSFMGMGGGGDPEAFKERPGEAMGGGGFGGMTELTTIVDLIMPGEGMGGLMRRFGGDTVGEGPLAEPGTYTLTMTLGDQTFSQTIEVDRKGEYKGDANPFAGEIER